MMIQIPINNTPSTYDVTLDNQNVILSVYYSLSANRWVMDVDNRTKNRSVQGLVMNISTDILAASNFLNLQVLMLINRENSFNEATVETLGNEVVLVYLDLETYKNFYFDGSVQIRQLQSIQSAKTVLIPGASVLSIPGQA